MSISAEVVAEEAESIGLGRYKSLIIGNEIDGEVLEMMEEKHIKEMGIKIVGHRLLFLKLIDDALKGRLGRKQAQKARQSQPRASRSSFDLPDPEPQQPQRQQRVAPASVSPRETARKSARQEQVEEKQLTKPQRPGVKKTSSVRQSQPKLPPRPVDDDDDRPSCPYCNRRFASDRIDKHIEICQRSSTRKTKVFDSRKQRLAGTDAAAFARNIDRPGPEPPKVDFVKEHEKVMERIRAARKLQAYEKAKEEGRAVGPPPALPNYDDEPDDRKQCPSCGRKFGEEQLARHMQHCTGPSGMARRATPARGRR